MISQITKKHRRLTELLSLHRKLEGGTAKSKVEKSNGVRISIVISCVCYFSGAPRLLSSVRKIAYANEITLYIHTRRIDFTYSSFKPLINFTTMLFCIFHLFSADARETTMCMHTRLMYLSILQDTHRLPTLLIATSIFLTLLINRDAPEK